MGQLCWGVLGSGNPGWACSCILGHPGGVWGAGWSVLASTEPNQLSLLVSHPSAGCPGCSITVGKFWDRVDVCKALWCLSSEKQPQFSFASHCWPEQVTQSTQVPEGGKCSEIILQNIQDPEKSRDLRLSLQSVSRTIEVEPSVCIYLSVFFFK